MQVGDSPSRVRAETVALHRSERTGKTKLEALSGIEGNDAAAAGHQIHQTLESSFHGIQILVNIRVIKLHRGQNDGVGKVVHELGALFEESSVVLVALEDEMFALSQSKTAAKVFRDAADQERGL